VSACVSITSVRAAAGGREAGRAPRGRRLCLLAPQRHDHRLARVEPVDDLGETIVGDAVRTPTARGCPLSSSTQTRAAVPVRRLRRRPAQRPAPPSPSAGGRKRSALVLTRSASGRVAVAMVTFAVMPGFKRRVPIVDAHHHVVGHDVLHRERRVADLLDASREGRRRVGVDRERHLLARRHRPDVRLAHARAHLHLGQVSATRKRVGVWKVAATVCPTSTLRATTTPSTGEVMSV